MNTRSMRTLVGVMLCASMLTACGDKTTAPRVAASLDAVGSLTVSGSVASVLTGPFFVRVKDSNGRGIGGIGASCVVESGGGSISIAAPVSKSDGTASCGSWTLGTRSGTQVLAVTVSPLAPVRFTATATAGIATQFVLATPPPSSIRSGVVVDPPVALQARDIYGNDSPAAGVNVTIVVNSAVVTGGTATTDASGRAVFASLKVNGTAGPRTMLFTTGASSLTLPAPAVFTLTAGVATQLVVLQSLPATVQAGATVSPALRVQLRDADGNNAAQSGLAVTATVPGANVSGATVATDAQGLAVFSALVITAAPGAYALTFSATGVQPSAAIPFQLVAASTTPASIEFGTGDAKVLILDPGQTVTMPAIVLRNNVNVILAGAQVILTVRSPAVATIGADGRLTGGEAGRTTVVASSVDVPTVMDSIVVHVTRGPGPLLRTDLTALALTIGVDFDVRVYVDTRTVGAVSAVTLDVAYPRFSPTLLQLQSVTPSTNTSTVASETAGLVRLVYVNSTGQSGLVELARLRFRALNGTPNFSQLVLTPLQVVTAGLQDLTGVTSAINPIFATRQ